MTHFPSPPPTPHHPKSQSQNPKPKKTPPSSSLSTNQPHLSTPLPSLPALDSFNRRSKGTPLFLSRPNPSHYSTPPSTRSDLCDRADAAPTPSIHSPPLHQHPGPAVHSPPSRVVGQLQKADLALPSRPFCSFSSYTHTPIPTSGARYSCPRTTLYPFAQVSLSRHRYHHHHPNRPPSDHDHDNVYPRLLPSCRPCCSTSRDYVRTLRWTARVRTAGRFRPPKATVRPNTSPII